MGKKRVVITGATGFVGSNLARRMLEQYNDVHLLVRKGYKAWRINEIIDRVGLYEVDLTQEEDVKSILKRIKPDWIMHTAVHGAYSSQTDLYEMVRTNIVGTMALVKAAMATDFECFINTGSSSEYGYKDHAPREKEWVEPNSYYAVTKATATQFCRYMAQSEKRNIYTVRLYSAYGEYEEPTRLMPVLVREGLIGKLPPLVDSEIARDYVYIRDIVAAYEKIAAVLPEEKGAVYNVATEKQTTLGELVALLKEILPIKEEPQWGSMAKRGWDTNSWVGDSSALKALGWKAKFKLKEGLEEMIAWQREQEQLPRKV